jgi:hypothetical protein
VDDFSKFESAWDAFGAACTDTIAPEATYQAWFAHFLMEQFEPLRVVREVDFGSRYLDEEGQRRFPGSNLMLDVMILRQSVVALPRRATLGPRHGSVTPNLRSGLQRLGKFVIVSELKVGATQEHGLTYGAVLRDYHKLDATSGRHRSTTRRTRCLPLWCASWTTTRSTA